MLADVEGLEETAVQRQEQKNIDCCPRSSVNQCFQGDSNIYKLIISVLMLDLNSRSMQNVQLIKGGLLCQQIYDEFYVEHGCQDQKNVHFCLLSSTNQCFQSDANIYKLVVSILVLDLNSGIFIVENTVDQWRFVMVADVVIFQRKLLSKIDVKSRKMLLFVLYLLHKSV